jgi:hypothetical protein
MNQQSKQVIFLVFFNIDTCLPWGVFPHRIEETFLTASPYCRVFETKIVVESGVNKGSKG